MNIPNEAVYTAAPIVAGAVLWIAKSFVGQIVQRAKRTTTVTTTVPAHVDLTLTDFTQISDLLKKELNGRYMFADEARRQFDDTRDRIESIETKLDTKVDELKQYISEVTHRPSTSRTRDGD